jgi:2-polyprenyl-3-methyl-5-hydroxy-6-metoxy-1,4-benzoquinol methylase
MPTVTARGSDLDLEPLVTTGSPAQGTMYDCGLDGCTLVQGRPVVDAGMDFLACPRCQVLRIPSDKLVHAQVDPDPVGSVSPVMRVLFGMRMIWLTTQIPELKRRDLRILDVGCGDGQFLEYLVGRGYARSAGIEPDEQRARNGRLREVPVFHSLDEARATGAVGEKVDLILVWHVLEHVSRPADFIRAYASLLAPGGRMLISVPNHASAQTRIFGRYSAYPDYGRHVWYHEANYIAALRRMAPDLTASLVRDRNFEYEIFSWVESLISWVTRDPTIVNRTLKKGEGRRSRKLQIATASVLLLPFAAILAPISIMSGRASTLTFSLERR